MERTCGRKKVKWIQNISQQTDVPEINLALHGDRQQAIILRNVPVWNADVNRTTIARDD